MGAGKAIKATAPSPLCNLPTYTRASPPCRQPGTLWRREPARVTQVCKPSPAAGLHTVPLP